MTVEEKNRKSRTTRLRIWLYLCSAVILLAGLVSSILIYRAAVNDEASDSSYEVIGGFVYPGGGAYNKRYVHDLQVYGGNAAMLADRFTRWFFGLWHGTSLAYTVAVIALLVSFIVYVVSNNVSASSKNDVLHGDSRDERA
jgi:multisubunit Na+/H+ antiporter MnhG subunit